MKQKLLEMRKMYKSIISAAEKQCIFGIAEYMEEVQDIVEKCIEELEEMQDSMYDEDADVE